MKYQPETKEELKALCDDLKVNLGDIDTSKISDMSYLFAFSSRSNKQFEGIEKWNVSNVTDMTEMFYRATYFNQPLNDWDVSNVTNMAGMFHYATYFNQPLNDWNVSKVIDMSEMFSFTENFNQPIDNWDVSKVKDMSHMFDGARHFNQLLNNWDVSSVTNMAGMFHIATYFNQPLNDWDVSKVKNMQDMFWRARNFNQNIENWDVSSVTNMFRIFENADKFDKSLDAWTINDECFIYSFARKCPIENDLTKMPKAVIKDLINNKEKTEQKNNFKYHPETKHELIKLCDDSTVNLGDIDTSKITDMSGLFMFTERTNEQFAGIEKWDVSNVTDMSDMFQGAKNFNQNIENWDVSKVTNMSCMFCSALHFNQPLNNWDVSKVKDMSRMFAYSKFNQDISSWNVSNVTNINAIFKSSPFNFDVNDWDVSNVEKCWEPFDKLTITDVELEPYKFDLSKWLDPENPKGLKIEKIFPEIAEYVTYKYWDGIGPGPTANFSEMFDFNFNNPNCRGTSFENIKNVDWSFINDKTKDWTVTVHNKEMLQELLRDKDITNLQKLDVSEIEDFSNLCECCLERTDFSGIEKWDMSNAKNVSFMFTGTNFNHDVSQWKLPDYCITEGMFVGTEISNSNFHKAANAFKLDPYQSELLITEKDLIPNDYNLNPRIFEGEDEIPQDISWNLKKNEAVDKLFNKLSDIEKELIETKNSIINYVRNR